VLTALAIDLAQTGLPGNDAPQSPAFCMRSVCRRAVPVLTRAIDEARNLRGRFFRVLMMQAVAGSRIGDERQRWQLSVQRVPVLDRTDNVVVGANVKDGHARTLQRAKHVFRWKCRTLGCGANLPMAQSARTSGLQPVFLASTRSYERTEAARLPSSPGSKKSVVN
jgi:hypothetical protein